MPNLARSPVASRTRSATISRGKEAQKTIDQPPVISTPSPELGAHPPATPAQFSQHPVSVSTHGTSRREESPSPSTHQASHEDQDSSEESISNRNFVEARGRPRGRASYASSDPALVQLLTLLTKQISGSTLQASSNSASSFKTPSMKAPDSYDGTPSKLRNFLQACQLIFHNDPKMFKNDKKKVLYASSFLTGKAGKWIEPYLTQLENEDPTYLLNSWSTFESQLFTLFGDPNELKKAEQDLDSLRMKDSGFALSYITDFRTLTTKISDWGERALMYHFRKGLPSRILDQLSVHQVPLNSLQDLMKATLDYDTRYHERVKEKQTHHPTSSSFKEKTSHSSPQVSSRPHQHKKKNFNRPQPQPQKKTFPSSSTSSNPIRPLLSRNGTLKAAEKERRVKEGLCTYCGGKHKLEDCSLLKAKNASTSNAPKNH